MYDTIDSIMLFCNRLESFFVKYSYLIKKLSKLDVCYKRNRTLYISLGELCCHVEVCDILCELPFRIFLDFYLLCDCIFAYFAFLTSNCDEMRIFLGCASRGQCPWPKSILRTSTDFTSCFFDDCIISQVVGIKNIAQILQI